MADFLWHAVSEGEKESIKKQAKEILDNFSKELSKVEKLSASVSVDRDDQEREEGKISVPAIDRKIMFDNAPEKNGDFIMAEKKEWK